MASGIVEVNPIWTALGADRAKALPSFHAFTGADNTGRHSQEPTTLGGLLESTGMNMYLKADDHVLGVCLCFLKP